MIPKVKKSIKVLVFNILENKVFEKLNKSRKDFIVSILWHICQRTTGLRQNCRLNLTKYFINIQLENE